MIYRLQSKGTACQKVAGTTFCQRLRAVDSKVFGGVSPKSFLGFRENFLNYSSLARHSAGKRHRDSGSKQMPPAVRTSSPNRYGRKASNGGNISLHCETHKGYLHMLLYTAESKRYTRIAQILPVFSFFSQAYVPGSTNFLAQFV